MLTRIKLLREKNGLSQKALAEKIGVSQQSINKYENHNIEPDIETLTRIAAFFDTSVDYIIGYSDIDHKLEQLQPCELNKDELAVIEKYRKLTCKQRNCLNLLVDTYLD